MPPSKEQIRSLEKRQQRHDLHREQILGYLTARGLDAAAADRFRLGYVEPNEEDPKRYWHRLAIPYITPAGIVQIRYRCILPHHEKGQDDRGCPKYLGDSGAETTLYNAQTTIDATRIIFLTEGEMDAIAVESIAGYPAVGIPGANAWGKHPHWPRCFVGIEQVILPADGDEAGAKLAGAVARSLPEVKIIELPPGDDANAVLARDPEEFASRCGLL